MKYFLIVVSIFTIIFSSGCVVVPTPASMNKPVAGTRQNLQKTIDFTEGQTTRQQVLMSLGEPDEYNVDDDIFTYTAKRLTDTRFTFLFFLAEVAETYGNIETKKLLIEFDDDNKIKSVTSDEKNKTGGVPYGSY